MNTTLKNNIVMAELRLEKMKEERKQYLSETGNKLSQAMAEDLSVEINKLTVIIGDAYLKLSK